MRFSLNCRTMRNGRRYNAEGLTSGLSAKVDSGPSFDYPIVMTLDEEATRLKELLSDKVVTNVVRHRADEIVVEFSDGSRMIVDAQSDLEISVT